MKQTGLSSIKGIGQAYVNKLALFDIHTIRDLIGFFPTSYKDLGNIETLTEELDGCYAVIRATLYTIHGGGQSRRGVHYFKLTCLSDEKVLSVTYFNQPYYMNKFQTGREYVFFGKIKRNNYVYEMTNALFEPSDKIIKLKGIIPIYRTRGLIPQATMWTIVKQAIASYDFATQGLTREQIAKTREAYTLIHSPSEKCDLLEAYSTVAYESLVCTLYSYRIVREERSHRTTVYSGDSTHMDKLCAMLPYELTISQCVAVSEIIEEMNGQFPMNRLLAGDVGSGKTIVALLAMVYAAGSDFQSVLLAPTELLATQHYNKSVELIDKLGFKCALLTSSIPIAEQRRIVERVACGEIDILFGTTSVVSSKVRFARLSLTVVDESHRFGVAVRAKLTDKGEQTDALIMTATPIPRAMALLTYGELTQSYIERRRALDELIETSLVQSVDSAMSIIEREVANGNQAFVVCPRVEEDSEGVEISVKGVYEQLMTDKLQSFRTAIVHGKQSETERDSVMAAFRKGEYDVLVASTVIEVGIDIPNATVMCILNAERFGLATLHQLRGRVGRGNAKSYCILVSEANSARLNKFLDLKGGLEVAELDLATRGEGEYVGFKQSGTSKDRLKQYYTPEMIVAAREAVARLSTSPEDTLEFRNSDKFRAPEELSKVVFN